MTNESYYYTSLEAKLKEMLTSTKIPLSPECEARAKVVEDMSYGDPIGKYRIYASSHPIEMKSFGSKIKSWFSISSNKPYRPSMSAANYLPQGYRKSSYCHVLVMSHMSNHPTSSQRPLRAVRFRFSLANLAMTYTHVFYF